MVKGLVVYDTTHGNTRVVAEVLAETLQQSGSEVDIFHVKDVRKVSAEKYDFLIVGSPTRFGTMSLAIRRFLGKVKASGWAGKPFVAFDTENLANLQKAEYSAGEKIAARLREQQMNHLAPVLKALVHEMKGPLLPGEVERARAYASDLAALLRQ
jgi:menaquinone-dependent protoporphyrinogen IX oxidase